MAWLPAAAHDPELCIYLEHETNGRLEACFLFVRISPSHRASLMAMDGEGARVVVPNLRLGSWVQITLDLDWDTGMFEIGFADFAAASWPDWPHAGMAEDQSRRLRFRGACTHIGQLSLLSLSDRGHATVSWTDLRFQ